MKQMKLLILLYILFLLSCGTKIAGTGNSSGEGNAITCKLVDNSGKPVSNTKVIVRPADYLDTNSTAKKLATFAIIDSGFTDKDGICSFDTTLELGIYSLEAIGPNGDRAFINSIRFEDKDSVQNVQDTLKSKSSVYGQIHLSYGDQLKDIQVLIYGLEILESTDDSGHFLIDSLAEGDYELLILFDNYKPETVTVSIEAGISDTINAIELKAYQGLPTCDAGDDIVVDFEGTVFLHGTAQDSFAGNIVTYEWDRDGAETVHGYEETDGKDTIVSITGDVTPYLRVTDNDGDTAVDSLKILVKPKPISISLSTNLSKINVFWYYGADPDFLSFKVYYDTIPGVDTNATLDTTSFDSSQFSHEIDNLSTGWYYIKVIVSDTTNLSTASEEDSIYLE